MRRVQLGSGRLAGTRASCAQCPEVESLLPYAPFVSDELGAQVVWEVVASHETAAQEDGGGSFPGDAAGFSLFVTADVLSFILYIHIIVVFHMYLSLSRSAPASHARGMVMLVIRLFEV